MLVSCVCSLPFTSVYPSGEIVSVRTCRVNFWLGCLSFVICVVSVLFGTSVVLPVFLAIPVSRIPTCLSLPILARWRHAVNRSLFACRSCAPLTPSTMPLPTPKTHTIISPNLLLLLGLPMSTHSLSHSIFLIGACFRLTSRRTLSRTLAWTRSTLLRLSWRWKTSLVSFAVTAERGERQTCHEASG